MFRAIRKYFQKPVEFEGGALRIRSLVHEGYERPLYGMNYSFEVKNQHGEWEKVDGVQEVVIRISVFEPTSVEILQLDTFSIPRPPRAVQP